MSVKRYEWMACDEHACHCDVVENAEGDMVDYEDYSALEARCAALAAENAGLKKVPATDSETMLLALDAFNTHGSTRPDAGLKQAINFVMQRMQTPATDAFLAEVRAQGVEMFASSLGSPYLERGEECYQDGYTHAIERIKCRKAPEFADQLRKGVQS